MRKFTTGLAQVHERLSGYAAGPVVRLKEWADEILGDVPGPWLAVYMVRRFGWPNIPSDDYKELCSWLLTTPIDGLYLEVTPYLGGGNLHFAVLFTESIGRKMHRDPGRERFQKRRLAALRAWWRTVGSTSYAIGWGVDGEDGDVLVHAGGWRPEVDGKLWGLWRRPEGMAKQRLPRDDLMLWWLGQFVDEHHPEVDLPKRLDADEVKDRSTPFHRRVESAIKRTMADLARTVYVRDVGFSVLGRASGPGVDRFEGAGYTPERWFSGKTKAGE